MTGKIRKAPAMHNAEKRASEEEIATRARLRAWRRAKRFDILVASTLLLLLIIGWVIRLAPPQPSPRTDFPAADSRSHTAERNFPPVMYGRPPVGKDF